MKKNSSMRFLLSFGVFIFGFTIQSFAQNVVLPEVKIVAVNYKYLNSVNDKETAMPVQRLEREAAAYDIKTASFYEDEYDNYFVSFYIPEGKILASYDKDGKLLRTAEKFKDTALPPAVRQAVSKRFPEWKITRDVYLVNYHESTGATKRYKILLENGDKRIKVTTDENGEFLK
ncbi:nicotinate-nucleotide adenylyltransferase [Pontibacter russatus]|uniref:nicotinate-nucleotide adenylyltransferase n=1 Tax=Pontibacter russatus TaxID=2694929 RepID=UPI00137B86ED|nr:nicotinate-nucleotide adenylyltransferase [Pontibacter russatus]